LKRLLIVNWQDIKNPQSGGAERNLHEIFKRLSQDFEITLFCSSFPDSPKEEVVDGMRVIRRGGRYDFNLVFLKYYLTWLRYEPFDIIIEDLNKIPFFTPLYSPLPKLCILHHFFGKVIYRETNPIFATYVYLTERLVGRLYPGVRFVAVSESTKRDLIRYGIRPDLISVVYNGVDTEFYQPVARKAPHPLIVSVGRIKRYKSIDHLILAVKEISPHLPELEVVIIGDGDDLPRLKQLTDRLGLRRRIRFTGWITEEEKRRIVSSAWIGVTTSAKEGFGLVNIEIQACGTPVISANSPGLRESVLDLETGLLYQYGNIGDLAEKIMRAIGEKSLRQKLTSNARGFAQRFSWDRAADQMREIITEILTRSQTPEQRF